MTNKQHRRLQHPNQPARGKTQKQAHGGEEQNNSDHGQKKIVQNTASLNKK
jgi:hypothetical protein